MAEIVSRILYRRTELTEAFGQITALQDIVALGLAIRGGEACWHFATRQGAVRPGENPKELDASIAPISGYFYLRAVCGLPGEQVEYWVDGGMHEEYHTALEEAASMLFRKFRGQVAARMPPWTPVVHHQGPTVRLTVSLFECRP